MPPGGGLSRLVSFGLLTLERWLELDFPWRGEFTDLNLLLKSARELANDNNVQGDITLRGNSLTVVNKSIQPIKNIPLAKN
jgi:hypothetical protein